MESAHQFKSRILIFFHETLRNDFVWKLEKNPYWSKMFVCVFFEQSDFLLFQLLKTEKCAICIKYVFKVNWKKLTLWYFYRKCQGKTDRQCSPPSGTSYCSWVPGVLCRPHSRAVIAIVRRTTFSLILILELFSCCSFFVELENE